MPRSYYLDQWLKKRLTLKPILHFFRKVTWAILQVGIVMHFELKMKMKWQRI